VYPETFAADYSRLEDTPFRREYMSKVSAVVVGAGALGNEVARILGLLGTSTVVVIDQDMVEVSNLPRSVFFSGQEVGQNKAWALAQIARRRFPDTEWAAIGTEIADVGFCRLADANLLFACVDSDLARLEIAYISTQLHIPVSDGGLRTRNHSHGRVTYFSGTSEHACYGCMLMPKKRRELLTLCEATIRPCCSRTAEEELMVGSTPTMASIVAGIQVETGIRYFLNARDGTARSSRSFEIQIYPSYRMDQFTIPVSVDCPFHCVQRSRHPLPRPEATWEELLEHTRGEAVILDWPMCVEARCSACAKEWMPMLRLGVFRRRASCPACGASDVLEMQTIRTIARDSPWLRRTASELQLPADHLYCVQKAH
jgi:molybdopterin/thiamine biosynthesis adenylyltransferase